MIVNAQLFDHIDLKGAIFSPTPLHAESTPCFTLSGVFSKETCNKMIQLSEEAPFGFTRFIQKTPDNTGNVEQSRILSHEVSFSELLFEKIKEYLPPFLLENNLRLDLHSVNPRWRISKYHEPADKVDAHYDLNFNLEGLTSKLTILLYLNGPPDFTGAETCFMDPSQRDKMVFKVNPEPGKLLIFEQQDEKMLHLSLPLGSGIKYVARTDVLYRWN